MPCTAHIPFPHSKGTVVMRSSDWLKSHNAEWQAEQGYYYCTSLLPPARDIEVQICVNKHHFPTYSLHSNLSHFKNFKESKHFQV